MFYSAPSPTGRELAYAETFAPFATTNTNPASTANYMTALSKTIVGTGRAVVVEFFAPAAYHSVANTQVGAVLMVNDDALSPRSQLTGETSPVTNGGPGIGFTRRIQLLAGVSYKLDVNIWGAAAGTSNIVAASYCPATLSVVSR